VVVARTPPKEIMLVPCVEPKFVPVIVTAVPTGPEVGFKLVTVTGVTTKFTGLLGKPPTVTTTGPVVAPVGTGTVMLASIQLIGDATIPLNVTVLPEGVGPKFDPPMNTKLPMAPEFIFRPVIVGVTVKATGLLGTPPAPTTTFPVVAPVGTGTTMLVALQLVGVAVVPLNTTALVPCAVPKLVPVIVTNVPTRAALGLIFVMFGVGSTVKATPLLDRDPTVTIALPEDAPGGTSTVILVELQLLAAAAGVPLKVTMLEPSVAPKLVPVIVTELPTGAEAGLRLVMLGGAPPPPPAALNAATAAPQLALAENVAVAATPPGVP